MKVIRSITIDPEVNEDILKRKSWNFSSWVNQLYKEEFFKNNIELLEDKLKVAKDIMKLKEEKNKDNIN